MSAMRTGVLFCLLCVGLTVSATPAENHALWRLVGVTVHLTNGSVLRGYVRYWHDYPEPTAADSLPATLLRWNNTALKLDTALIAVRYPDTLTIVTTAREVVIPGDSLASVSLAPGLLDGRQGDITPMVSYYQAGLLQTKPHAMCWGTTDSGAPAAWLSYDSLVGTEELTMLCRPPLIGYVAPEPGSNLIRLIFYYD